MPTQGKDWQECKEAIRAEVDKFVDDGLKCERNLSMEKTFELKRKVGPEKSYLHSLQSLCC